MKSRLGDVQCPPSRQWIVQIQGRILAGTKNIKISVFQHKQFSRKLPHAHALNLRWLRWKTDYTSYCSSLFFTVKLHNFLSSPSYSTSRNGAKNASGPYLLILGLASHLVPKSSFTGSTYFASAEQAQCPDVLASFTGIGRKKFWEGLTGAAYEFRP